MPVIPSLFGQKKTRDRTFQLQVEAVHDARTDRRSYSRPIQLLLARIVLDELQVQRRSWLNDDRKVVRFRIDCSGTMGVAQFEQLVGPCIADGEYGIGVGEAVVDRTRLAIGRGKAILDVPWLRYSSLLRLHSM